MRKGLARGIIIFALVIGLLHGIAHADPISAIFGFIAAAQAVMTAVLTAVITAVVSTAISYGVSAIASAVSKRKQASSVGYSFADAAGGRINVSRSSIETHKVIYGRVRVSGPMVFVDTTDQSIYVADVKNTLIRKSNLLHMVIPLACHEVEDIETIYIDETPLTLDIDGNATNSEYVTTYARPGGTSYHVRVKKYLGTADQQADPDLMAAFPGKWTANHRLRGIAYIYVVLRYFGYNTNVGGPKVFPNGAPNVSAIVKGKKVYDPRTSLTAYSNNWALCIRDYESNSDYGLGCTDAELDDDSFIAAANISDEDVILPDGTTQKRYTCNGQIDTAANPLEVLKDLLSAGAGTTPYTQGKFRCFAGAYTEPSHTIDETWLAGEIEIQPRPPRQDLYNAVKGIYVDPEKGWQPTDFPMVTNPLYVAQDGGVQIVRDLELPYTLDPYTSQRIAKIALEKGRQGILANFPCNWKALRAAIWDTAEVSIDKLGWDHKVFRIIGWELSPEAVINLKLQEESAASYDWNDGEATTYDPAPDTNLPDPRVVDAPGNPVVSEAIYETTDGSGVKTRVTLTWAESESAFIQYYQVQFKPKDGEEEDYQGLPDAYGNSLVVNDFAPGVYDFRVRALNFSQAYSDWATTRKEIFGLTAPPSDITGFNINVISNQAHLSWAQHPDLDVRSGGYIRLRWSSNVTDATWSEGTDIADALPGIATHVTVPAQQGTYMIKAYDSTGHESVNFNSAILVNNPNVVGFSPEIILGESVIDGSEYPGTLVNLIKYKDEYHSSPTFNTEFFILDGIGNFDDAPGNFDDLPGVFDAGGGSGFVSSGSYTQQSYRNLGAIYTIRLSMKPNILVYDGTQLFDQADGLFDDREGLFDGTDRSDTYVDFYIKTTNSNPVGSTSPDDAIWSEWKKFFVADLTCRAFWIKTVITNNKASNGVSISDLRPRVVYPFREERFIQEDIDAAGTLLTFNLPFQLDPPAITVLIRSAESGDTPVITINGLNSFPSISVQILNGGIGVARTCDVIARGY